MNNEANLKTRNHDTAVMDASGALKQLVNMTKKPTHSQILVTIPQACEQLAVSRTTIYQLIKAQRLRSVTIGTRGIRIPVSELERFINDNIELDGGAA